ncbi:MAG: tyrosine--tRNA ligase [Proteobacteria bacterium]|jgi:tyrosyl-tRNA synthetase|nr:tyrosine--tRNA ligase [Pseudomonadota bacterium]
MDVFEILEERGFIQQCTNMALVHQALSQGPVSFYVGIDPTGNSLHIGHLLPVMAMCWLQRAGHRPIAVMGAGTAMVGDPSGKTEMRQMLSVEQIEANGQALKTQLDHFLVLDGEAGIMVNNADWLLKLNYIAFLREIGRHFSVNRMLAAEAYKQRLERGLSFIEFNYQLLQAYDFLELYRRHECTLQVGGDDQWGNILAGTDLIRRMEQAEAHGLTLPLITTASGAKMGKTAQGALWLDPAKCPVFDYYQYWINVDDRDVGRFLRLYTFLTLDQIVELEKLQGADIREAKRVLAYEATKLVHGEAEAEKAKAAASAMVAHKATDDMPTFALHNEDKLVVVLADAGLAKSRGAARRLISQGGVRVEGEKVSDVDLVLSPANLGDEGLVVRVGKKRAVRVVAP